MTEIKAKELQELWEWCGFKVVSRFGGSLSQATEFLWEYPDGNHYKQPPEPDLNSLFKYVVPKLRETYADLRVIFTYTSVANCSIYQYGKLYSRKKNFEWLRLGNYTDEDPALALYQAIQKARKVSNDRDK